jgi:hypothetical protein
MIISFLARQMRIVHDGAGFSRTEKVAYIATNRPASKVLKVSREGKEPHKNCGVCEKCIRTQANFLAVGVTHPACFDAPLDPRQIKTMSLSDDVLCTELESIIAYAKTQGITGKWFLLKYPFCNINARKLDGAIEAP